MCWTCRAMTAWNVDRSSSWSGPARSMISMALRIGASGLRSSWDSIARNSSLRRSASTSSRSARLRSVMSWQVPIMRIGRAAGVGFEHGPGVHVTNGAVGAHDPKFVLARHAPLDLGRQAGANPFAIVRVDELEEGGRGDVEGARFVAEDPERLVRPAHGSRVRAGGVDQRPLEAAHVRGRLRSLEHALALAQRLLGGAESPMMSLESTTKPRTFPLESLWGMYVARTSRAGPLL